MEMLIMVLSGLSFVLGIISLICWIMEIVAAFQNGDGPLMGILSIVLCGLGGFIIGWVHHSKWGITKLMTAWTVVFIGSILIQVAVFAVAATIAVNQANEPGGFDGPDFQMPVEIQPAPQ